MKSKFMKQTAMKSLFEQMGITYRHEGEYLIPNIIPHNEENHPIGIWGQRHLRYLKQKHRVIYYNLLTSGKLNGYIVEIDKQADDMFFRLVKQMTERQGVTERLKSADQMLWIQKTNNISNRAMEIVNNEIIYSA